MGYWSDYQIKQSEQPNLSSVNKTVCSDCAMDDFLSDLVLKNLCSNKCSYCLKRSEQYIATSYEVIMQHIYKTIFLYYKDAQETNMPYVEKSWLNDQVDIEDIFLDFDPGWCEQLSDDLKSSADPNWYLIHHVDSDWIALAEHEIFAYGWNKFKEQVLYKTRYLFLNQTESYGSEDIPVSSMLNELAQLCRDLNLIKEIPKDTEVFRVRSHCDNKSFTQFSDMGVPPRGIASAGRMNPAGISYFYVAYDEVTAISEVITNQEYWSIAKFKLKENIQVIDFSNIPKVPSEFDIKAISEREKLLFLHNFVNDLSKPVEKDGREHVDYVPTQIVSEFFRYVFLPTIKGLKYNSIKNVGGLNIAFFESDNDELEKIFELISISLNN
ncbi:HEPN-associated N-terminal domain-containing protein [Acinetobacter dispersus]|uniref:RES domain-containing protein n=1 Tax=Acinetobacter dispersus TaxID=70348 RepID=N9MUM4_9GAMM|nr:HEPN-associated N-terminal domain-containing protein [Acinetobacter dispersus]ENW94406.1 hypothetical protein F904_01332 [Acinetobacter dispersus]